MSKVRKLRPPNRLKTLAFSGGGVTVANALRAAGEKLAELRPPCEKEIARRVGEIDRGFGRASPDRTYRDLEDLYALSSGIIDAAAATPSPWVARAAHALCDVVDHCQMRGETDWEALDVHIGSLVLLHQAGEAVPPQAARRILGGLGDVFRKRFGEPETEAGAET